MKRTIRVTKTDIRRGAELIKKRSRAKNCPVSLAVKRATKQSEVCVTDLTIEVGRKEIYTPKRVERFIDRFDAGKPVRPFKFVLDLK